MNEDRQIRERYDLTIERIRSIVLEKTVAPAYQDYFQKVSRFLVDIDAILNRISSKKVEDCTLEELQNENENIYQDVLGDN